MKTNSETIDDWAWADFQAEATRLTGAEAGTEDNDIGSMMLMSIKVGAARHHLKFACPKWTPAMECAWLNLKKSMVFRQGVVFAEWLDDTNGGIAFNCDLMVAKGLLERDMAPADALVAAGKNAEDK